MATTDEHDELIDTIEAARRMGIARNTLNGWRSRQVPDQPTPVIVGSRSVRYRASDVAAWIAARQPTPKAPRQ